MPCKIQKVYTLNYCIKNVLYLKYVIFAPSMENVKAMCKVLRIFIYTPRIFLLFLLLYSLLLLALSSGLVKL